MDSCALKYRLPAYLDGALCFEDSREFKVHLSACASCSAQVEAISNLRNTLRTLPKHVPPSDLTLRLRVTASRERVRARRRFPWLHELADKVRLAGENLMRPLALPLVGGLCAAILLFTSLVPTFTLRMTPGDIPIGFATEPTVKSMAPLGFMDGGDAVVDLRIDEEGRIVNYSILEADGKRAEDLRRSIENNLLFTTFTPATAFGRPIAGTIRISFRSSRIDVRG